MRGARDTAPARCTPRLARAALAGVALLLLGAPGPWSGKPADSSPVVILSSLRIRPYEMLAKQVSERCRGRDVRVLYLDEKPEAAAGLPALNPAAIVTVGQDALRKALPHRGGSPLVFTMVLSPRSLLPEPVPGVTGVAMLPSPRQELLAIQKGFRVKHLVAFSDPRVSAGLVRDLEAGTPPGMDLRVVPVKSEADLLGKLEGTLAEADGILLIPDTTVLTEGSLKRFMASSYTRKIPVFGFSPLYIDLGAAATISVDEGEVARKAVSLALDTDNGPSDQMGDMHYLRSCLIHLNPEASRRLSLRPDRAALSQFGRVVEGR